MAFLILLPLIAQAAALNAPGVAGLNLPQIDRPTTPNRRRYAPPALNLDLPASPLKLCLDAAQTDAKAGEQRARNWLKDAAKKGLADTAQPQLCLGSALAAQGEWLGAEKTFLAAREAATSDLVLRAQASGMAGNAALAAGAPDRALTMLDTAHGDALTAARPLLAGSIALDRARALVALKRPAEAETALAEARASLPEDPQAWLLSATLARRQGQLPQAQTFIENAANLAPAASDVSGDIGLEAGVIAMLAGHEEAARKSWASVVSAAPGSEAGQRAASYLAQIGPAAQPASNR